MEPAEIKRKLQPEALSKRLQLYPKTHLLVASALVVILATVLSLPSEEASASRQSLVLDLPVLEEPPLEPETPSPLSEAPAAEAAAEPEAPAHTDVSPKLKVVNEAVRPGDTLSSIFYRAGLSDRDVYNVVSSSDEGKKLARLYPGHEFVFTLDTEGKLVRLNHIIDRLNSQTFTYADGQFVHEKRVRSPDTQLALKSGTIRSSLYKAGMEAELTDKLIMQLAAIFGWDIDFILDIRNGDRFKILYEESFLDGEKIGTGNILAAEFVNQGESFKAVRYVDEHGEAQYYTPTGKAMRKAFLRAPVDFRRISSNFNPRRLHPIHKTVRPHRGTDYAANRGTPVWASGDGKVVASGYTKPNGNYIVIQHGGDVQTKYLHLHKRHVRVGERVQQKEIIGTVGSTGYSTAPHLHYEFLLNGVHRNPRTIIDKLPKAKSIAKDKMPRFYQQTQSLLAQLEQTTQMAALEGDANAL